jgi:hypothetical protein
MRTSYRYGPVDQSVLLDGLTTAPTLRDADHRYWLSNRAIKKVQGKSLISPGI